ncbi:MAG: ketopantoate reductase family protein [Anaerolineales bacterium]|nr:ketopantoate reductase family protein [Anaerolineales bacterium]
MNVTIFGTGAMACLVGAAVAPVASVTLVGTWPKGLAALRTHGIRVEGRPAGPVRVAALGEAAPPARLALVLVKTWQTATVAAALPGYLAPDGLALTLQNGLGNVELLGPRACLGVTTLGATLLGPGQVRPGGEGVTRMAAPAWVAELLNAAGLEAAAVAAAQVDGLLWGKLAVNCGINALTALLRVPNGALLDRPDAVALLNAAAEECAAVAAAQGIALPYADAAGAARAVAQRTAANRSSMFQDILRGAPTEIEAINGAVARTAERLGQPAPVNTVLARLVRAAVATDPQGQCGAAR